MPTGDFTVNAATSIWIGEFWPTKEIVLTTRTAETLTVKTCPDEADQPGSGKVDAYMFERIVIKEVYDNDNEQDARDITEHKKPE